MYLSDGRFIQIATGKTAGLMGEVEKTERFLHVSLFQGVSRVSSQMQIGLRREKKQNSLLPPSSDIPAGKRFAGSVEEASDPCVFATSFEKRRFFVFSRREPDTSEEPRDVINEKEVGEEEILEEEGVEAKNFMAKRVILRTTMGDIELELWKDVAPKA